MVGSASVSPLSGYHQFGVVTLPIAIFSDHKTILIYDKSSGHSLSDKLLLRPLDRVK